MKSILYCRRTFMALIAIGTLAAMSFIKGIDTSAAIAAVAIGLAGANAAEGVARHKKSTYRKEG